MNMKKSDLIPAIPYVVIGYAADKMSWLYRQQTARTSLAKIMNTMTDCKAAFRNPLPSLNPRDLLIGAAGSVALYAFFRYRKANAKKLRTGEEYGTARWGTKKDIEPFMDNKELTNNMILTQTEMLRVNGRSPHYKYDRNLNVLVQGSSGTGKTRFFIKPQLMQMNCSYVVTDPKGTVAIECGKMLLDNGYRVKIFNLIDMKESMKYNPFMYISCEQDIVQFVDTLMKNTTTKGAAKGEDFWQKAEALYFQALIAYIWYEAPVEEQNFETLISMLDASEVREDDEDFKNSVDELFDELEEREPDHYAVRQYKKYKNAAGKTAKSILISCGARMAPFDIAEVRELTKSDDMELDRIGEEKTALFVIIPDTNSTFNFIVSIMYSQLLDINCKKALKVYGGKLPIHVRLLLDEFSNIGQIPDFEKIIAVIRSRNMSASIVIQSKSQLKSLYKDDADTIIENCDSQLFLGGTAPETLKDTEEKLGKETIDTFNTSDTRGGNSSFSMSYQKLGRSLMTRDQISVMDNEKCLLFLRGVYPFYSDKYDITGHPQYKNLSDADPKNKLDLAKYVRGYGKPKFRKDEKVDEFFDFGVIDDDDEAALNDTNPDDKKHSIVMIPV